MEKVNVISADEGIFHDIYTLQGLLPESTIITLDCAVYEQVYKTLKAPLCSSKPILR